MSVLIRVADEPPRGRLDYFRQVVADTFVPFDLHVDVDDDLSAQLLTGQVGTLDVTKVSAPPLKAVRTPRLIRVSDPESFKLEVPVRGNTVFLQGDRAAALTPGDSTLLDLSRPCRLVDHGDEHGNVAVRFPHSALPLPHDEVARVTAVPFSGRDGLGAAISSLTRHMARTLESGGPAAGDRLATALLDLVIVALAERLDRSSTLPPVTHRRALLASAQTFIDQHLADPALSPGAVAAAQHISLRYLYKLFESQHTSVAGWIRERRLERCRRDLADATLAHWSVSAIGARWGFTDSAHFSRAFRARYDLAPTEYRRTARTTGSR
jgi:AraC-like DNA-binding protein